MKKFLTVLLALSVVFTYTVGSAFAAVADSDKISAADARAAVEAEYLEALKVLDKAMEEQLEEYFEGTTTSVTKPELAGGRIEISEATAKAVMEEKLYAEYKADIETKYYANVTKLENLIADKDFIAFTKGNAEDGYPHFDIADYKGYNAAPNFELDRYGTELADKQFAEVKMDAQAFVSAIDLSLYNKEVAAGKEESNYDVAARLKAYAETAIANVEAASGINHAAAGIKKIQSIYTPAEGLADPTGALYVGGKVDNVDYTPGLNNIPKISDEETIKADLAYAKEKTLSTIKKGLTDDKDKIVDAYQVAIRVENSKAKPNADTISELNKKIADTKDAYEAAVATIEYVVESCTEIEQLGNFDASNIFVGKWSYNTSAADTLEAFLAANVTGTPFKSTAYAGGTITVADCVKNAELVADAKEDAEKAKAYIELDGDIAIQIDEALEDAIDEIYTTGAGEFEAPTMYTVVAARIKALLEAPAGTVKVGTKTYDTVKVWRSKADSGKGYDTSMFDEIRAIADETKAAVKAAKTVEEADAAFLAGYAKFDAVPTSLEHAAMFNTLTGALKADYDSYVKSLTKIASGIAAVDAGKTGYEYLTAADLTAFVDAVKADMKANCYTAEELKAVYDEAVATLNNLKTDSQIKAERDAVEATIKALPTTVTLADKDAVKAAYDAKEAYVDYVELVGAKDKYPVNPTYLAALDAKYNAVKVLQKEEIKKAYDALNKNLGDLTLADKDAVEALRAAVDEYVAYYQTKDMTNTAIANLEKETGTTNLATMETEIALLQVEAVVDMIARLPVNTVDVDAINAARAAFDALPEGYGIDGKYYDKLIALEKLMAKEVESLKITASSTAKKGSITVKWTVKGNAAAADGFRVYRSTKKNSGYGKTYYFQTKDSTKRFYKNTKQLKKGTRYYYKVRAYKIVDGKTYFSDFSNKAYRIAK